ncbi:MAG TPA: FtsX-like permease family protein, partial [Gemmatimonadota bacterium]|nr:FtsX-like permease family protein [Gemmatimonadota bacterium]
TGGLPLGGVLWTRPYGPGGSAPSEWSGDGANFRVVSSGYFRALGTRLLAGRPFTSREDEVEERRVAIVDATLARRLSPDGTVTGALGRRLGFPLDGEAVEAEVVGVVDPVRYESLRGPVRPTIYVPYRQEASRAVGVAVRTEGPSADLEVGVRRVLEAMQAASIVPVFDVRPMRAYLAEATAPTRFALVLVVAFALIAVVLAGVGVFGSVAYGVRSRRREIGIRMAVGATPARVTRRFALRGFAPVLVGVGVGLAVAAASARTLGGLLGGVAAPDGPVLVAAGAAMLVVGALASFLPARAAVRVEPAEVLREE